MACQLIAIVEIGVRCVVFYNNEKYQNIRRLLDLFKIEFYVYTTKRYNTTKEEIIIDSINKLK